MDFSDWFVCPKCGEEEKLSVKKVLGVGNFSVNFKCGSCRYRHIERDVTCSNWRWEIDLKHLLTGQTIRSPSVSRKAKRMVRCPACGSESVAFWIYSENDGLGGGKMVSHTRLDCQECQIYQTGTTKHSS